MDIASVVGLVLGVALLLISVAISPGSPFSAFINYPSMAVVIGGSIAAVLICFPLKSMLSMGTVIKNVFFNKQQEAAELIDLLVSLAETARRDGLLALEGRIDEVDDRFIILGVQLAVDGARPEVMEDVMRTEMDAVATRHANGKMVVDQMGRFAPAFGMIGTLMGLIMMLGDLTDTASLGPSMAVALITTLYGAVVSNLLFLPFGEKLGFLNKAELLSMEIVMRGILAIQSGENPRIIHQKLTTFLAPSARKKAEEAE